VQQKQSKILLANVFSSFFSVRICIRNSLPKIVIDITGELIVIAAIKQQFLVDG
jgi:hypothetical protein